MKEPIILTKDGEIPVITKNNIPDPERKFECNECLRTFKRKNHLKEHVLSHLGVKSKICNICNKSFGKVSVLNRHMLYHYEKKFKCEICNASFILYSDSLKHSTQRNVMCPYCQKCFKSKPTCRTHMLIHKTEWVKQFKEQIKAGTIQFEEDAPNPSNLVLDIMTSVTNEDEEIRQTLNETPSAFLNFSVNDIEENCTNADILETQNASASIQENTQILFSNLVEETQIDDSPHNASVNDIQENTQILFNNLVEETQIDEGNQFQYFLLLPTSTESNENGIATDVRTETEQFMVNGESLSLPNLQFIQLEQPPLLDLQNSSSTELLSSYQLNAVHMEAQTSEPEPLPGLLPEPLPEPPPEQETNLITDCANNMTDIAVDNSEATQTNVTATESNETAVVENNSTNSRIRKPTKPINKCETCSKIFQKPIDLRRHIRTHTLEKPFSCTICPKAFSLKSTLQSHVKHKHENVKELFPCTVCWKAYSSRHSMLTHMLIHSNSRPFQCEYCTIAFRTRGNLKIHQQIHLRESTKHGVNPSDVKTKIKNTKLLPLLNIMKEVSDSNVRVDVEDHSELTETLRVDRLDPWINDANEKANFSDTLVEAVVHQCSSCSEQFSNKENLKAHMRTHKESLQCSECGKIFKKLSLLKRHMVVHIGRKDFSCEICQKADTQKVTLQAHMSLHTVDALFECSKCQKKCNFKTNLINHEKKCTYLNDFVECTYDGTDVTLRNP